MFTLRGTNMDAIYTKNSLFNKIKALYMPLKVLILSLFPPCLSNQGFFCVLIDYFGTINHLKN